MSESRKLNTILFADIAGYTALMQSNEDQALTFLASFEKILKKVVPQFGGKIVQYFGDACLLSFDSTTLGVQCAVELQQAFREKKLPVRIGMHLGEVVFTETNVFGDGVNIASRIESMGVTGSVLVSQAIRNQLKNKKEFDLVSVGKFDFKNVDEPLEVFAVVNEGLVLPKRGEMKGKFKERTSRMQLAKAALIYLGLAWVVMELSNFFILQLDLDPLYLNVLIIFLVFGLFITLSSSYFKGRWNTKAIILNSILILAAIFSSGIYAMNPLLINPSALRVIKLGGKRAPLENLESVAVLPIQNNLPDAENDYLLAGLHEGIITELGKLGTLKTISSTSMQQYEGSGKSVKQIGKELGVNAILESSLSSASEDYVYRVRLIDATDEYLIWSEEFATVVSELPTFFDAMAKIIASKLNPEAIEDRVIHENVQPEAYKEIVQGNQLLNEFTKGKILESLDHFNTAIGYDSTNIAGYLGVVKAWSYLNQLGMVDPQDAQKAILKHGKKAIGIDSTHWATLDYLGYKAAFIDYDFERSIEFYQQSLAQNPNNSSVRIKLAISYTFINDWQNANRQVRYAKEIDPFNPEVLIMEIAMFSNGGKILSALNALKELAILDPDHPFVKISGIVINRDFGRDAKAIEAMKDFFSTYDLVSNPLSLVETIEREYAKTNDVNRTWFAVVKKMEELSYDGYFPVMVTSLLGKSLPPGFDDDWFFENLNQLAKDRHPEIPYFAIKSDNPLQDDPRYIKIMEELELW